MSFVKQSFFFCYYSGVVTPSLEAASCRYVHKAHMHAGSVHLCSACGERNVKMEARQGQGWSIVEVKSAFSWSLCQGWQIRFKKKKDRFKYVTLRFGVWMDIIGRCGHCCYTGDQLHNMSCVPIQSCLLQSPYFETEYVTTVRRGCPIPQAPPNAALKCDPVYPLQSPLTIPQSSLGIV